MQIGSLQIRVHDSSIFRLYRVVIKPQDCRTSSSKQPCHFIQKNQINKSWLHVIKFHRYHLLTPLKCVTNTTHKAPESYGGRKATRVLIIVWWRINFDISLKCSVHFASSVRHCHPDQPGGITCKYRARVATFLVGRLWQKTQTYLCYKQLTALDRHERTKLFSHLVQRYLMLSTTPVIWSYPPRTDGRQTLRWWETANA